MVHIRRRDVADPLVVPLAVEALELAVGLGMVGRAVDVPDPEGAQVVLKRGCQVEY